MDNASWQATVHGVARVKHDLVTKPPPNENICKSLDLQNNRMCSGKGTMVKS